MFKIQPKLPQQVRTTYTVYDVRNDKNGYPHFLIYKDNEWKYVSAKHFVPVQVVNI